ncbi:D-alanyl-D-alanine carboxypeptidase (penicillin-binding protein 5/6) [Palleronia marisminoris]|uniref:serine-type D-Ala-D-Ala carboxypeptidase n=1 Tax=Palleronia marisminoris TaxID=315423 RepID=A0A1Y5SDV1_9RHOB|nr:D-alanyl-D-alanine carboxypeptidase family protein [Palleronia marisminoris]SFG69695.1 D-alanyl-D-alanine carboxypeptidase (penicillin-binding protein 5/6) [Palleronia marisminoris]SLN35711.1 D-alanyl-D-alanine carboxypeptidase DacC precursor [Palleronia marisminoris]
MLIIRCLYACLALLVAMPAAAFETQATAAYVYDLTTDTVLLGKNQDEPLPPASMSKLMTLNMLFEALEDGRVDMDTRFGVSTRAKSMGGSTMFLNERDRPTVEELIQGIVVMSGNDACVVVAEGLAGSEEAFAQQMTDRARDLGMMNSTFANSSGWPDPNHRMSVHDLGILAERLIEHFPEYYGYFAQKEFAFDNRAPSNRFNRNPLLDLGIGADGLKTGHTSEAGYGLVGSAAQGDRRIVFVITGLGSTEARADEAERIVNWAFRQFVQKTIVEEGETVATADVWMGEAKSVNLVTASGQSMLVPALEQDQIEAIATFVEPLVAPVSKGDEVGSLTIQIEGLPNQQVPLLAASDVAEGGFGPRLQVAASVLFARAMDRATGDGSTTEEPIAETQAE